MRIGCLQFAPRLGEVDNNLNRADAVLNRADPDSLDLLVLPELAFSGMSSLPNLSSGLLKRQANIEVTHAWSFSYKSRPRSANLRKDIILGPCKRSRPFSNIQAQVSRRFGPARLH